MWLRSGATARGPTVVGGDQVRSSQREGDVMSIRGIVRQGDVLLVPIEAEPRRVGPARRDDGALVVAAGEVTGHAHVVSGDADLLDVYTGAAGLYVKRGLLVRVGGAGARLVHEEHDAVPLAPGLYRVHRQR